jgi:hypothetical protein
MIRLAARPLFPIQVFGMTRAFRPKPSRFMLACLLLNPIMLAGTVCPLTIKVR